MKKPTSNAGPSLHFSCQGTIASKPKHSTAEITMEISIYWDQEEESSPLTNPEQIGAADGTKRHLRILPTPTGK